MFPIPAAAEPLVDAIRSAFTRRTFDRFVLLMSGLIVTMGRRTVSRVLLIIQPHQDGHWCNYHRLYSQAKYSMWKLGLALTQLVIGMLPADSPIMLIVDETVDGKEGDHVWARGTHYDSRRSSRRHKRIKFGHQWLVMCVLVWLPGIDRPWALPILGPVQRQAAGQKDRPARKARQRHQQATADPPDAMVPEAKVHFARRFQGFDACGGVLRARSR